MCFDCLRMISDLGFISTFYNFNSLQTAWKIGLLGWCSISLRRRDPIAGSFDQTTLSRCWLRGTSPVLETAAHVLNQQPVTGHIIGWQAA